MEGERTVELNVRRRGGKNYFLPEKSETVKCRTRHWTWFSNIIWFFQENLGRKFQQKEAQYELVTLYPEKKDSGLYHCQGDSCGLDRCLLNAWVVKLVPGHHSPSYLCLLADMKWASSSTTDLARSNRINCHGPNPQEQWVTSTFSSS